jgi:hypothetical protein
MMCGVIYKKICLLLENYEKELIAVPSRIHALAPAVPVKSRLFVEERGPAPEKSVPGAVLLPVCLLVPAVLSCPVPLDMVSLHSITAALL